MTVARGVAVAALALAIVLVAVLLLRGGGTHQYDLVFQNAGQLVKDDDVQVGGRRIGSIRKITLTDDNQARVTVEIQEPYAPLHEGTQATIRPTSLSGIANRYIALTPAPNSAKEIDDEATLPVGSTTDVVDLDQLFNTLDPDTRKDLQEVIQGFAAQYEGKGAQAAKSAEYFNPFLSTSRRLVNELTEDEGTLTDFIVNSSRAVTAVAERRDDLADLVGNTNATARAIGVRERRARPGARAAADDAAPGQHDVREPARDARRPRRARGRVQAGDEGPRPVPARAAPARRRLAAHDQRPAQARDDARRRQRPARRDCASCPSSSRSPARPSSTRPRRSRRASRCSSSSAPTPQSSWAGSTTSARRPPTTTPTATSPASSRSSTPSPSPTTPPAACCARRRLNDQFAGLQTNIAERCPGAATQPAADGSAPCTDDGKLGANDCDPSQVLPGP